MSDRDDFAFEPQPGLPAPLPEGERILWQGRPDTTALAREAFLTRWVMGYFAVIAAARFAVAAADLPLAPSAAVAAPYLVLGLLAVGILRLMAWAQARATVYTITTARVLMRIGAALTVTWNIPFRQVATARLDLRPGGTGTIALETLGETRIAYLALWPHVRPWRMQRPEPALRCIPDAARVAQILAEAAEARVSLPVVERRTPTTTPAAAVAAE
jgi:hypothetical protein